jgi:O-antigen ligase
MGQSGRNQLAIIVPLVVPPLFSKLISKRYATRFLFLVDGLILGIVLFSILLSLSRSAFLNAFLGISWVFLWSQPWHHKIRLLFMGLILFGAMVFVFSISPVAVGRLVSILEVFGKDVQTYGASTGHSVLVRKELLQTAFDLWRKSPLFGIGSGNFLENTVFVDNSTLNAVTHNEYARWLVELGLFGLSLLLLFLTSHFFYIIHSLKSKVRLDLPRWLIIGISGTFICFVFQMLFININYHYYFWIAMGLTARVIFSKPISMERSLKI